MLPAASLVLTLWCTWRGAPPLAVVLMAAGTVLQALLVVRLLKATTGGVGGHAEWVRAISGRRRLHRHPVWIVAVAMVLAGLVAALRW